MSSTEFRVEWCSREAAKFACEKWHYSGCLPAGKMITLGVWGESGILGALVFAHGTNRNIGRPYGLSMKEVCELARVALDRHPGILVSQIMARAIKLLAAQCPGLRLIVSYADPGHGHVGKVYQAANWIYVGKSGFVVKIVYLRGKWRRWRSICSLGLKSNDLIGLPTRKELSKFCYVYPLDRHMRRFAKKLEKPYPSSLDDSFDHAVARVASTSLPAK